MMSNKTVFFFHLHMPHIKNKYSSESKGHLEDISVLGSLDFCSKS